MDDLAALVGRGPVLVLAPHPDDETLGCGALLATCWMRGLVAHVCCLTDGAASHPASRMDIAGIRAAELAMAVTILGGVPRRDITCLGHPDAALHEVAPERVMGEVLELSDRLDAAVLVAPSILDPHCDHVTAATLAKEVCAARPHLRLLSYPIWSRWSCGGQVPAHPGAYRRTFDGACPAKASAIAAHSSQLGRVVTDDPTGFAMPAGFVEMFVAGPEIYDEQVGR